MIPYIVFKYWTRIVVGTMVSIVLVTLSLFSYSLAHTRSTSQSSQSDIATTQEAYKRSASLLGQIQELKLKKQDTTKLESLYTASVENLSKQNQKEAENQLNQLETQIVKMNESLSGTLTPQPTGEVSVTPSPEPSAGETTPTASDSADQN